MYQQLLYLMVDQLISNYKPAIKKSFSGFFCLTRQACHFAIGLHGDLFRGSVLLAIRLFPRVNPLAKVENSSFLMIAK
jgi:hypothetical protein